MSFQVMAFLVITFTVIALIANQAILDCEFTTRNRASLYNVMSHL